MGTLAQLLLFAIIARVASQHSHDHGGVDVFSQVLAKLNATNAERLPFAATEIFVDRVFHRFTCSGNGTCQEAICLDTDGLFTLLGADRSLGLSETQFHDLASVLVHYVLHLSSHCHATVNPATANLTQIHEALKTRFDEENSGTISEEAIDHVLEGLVSSLSKEEHAEEEGDDHAHEEEGHDDDHADEVQVIEKMCLSADALLHEIRAEDGAPVSRMEDIALFLVYHLFTESTIKERCRLLPKKKYFLDELFEMYHAVNGTITKTEFTELLKALNLTMASNTTTDSDPHLHAHRRRRSAAVANARQQKVSRRRRAAMDHAHELGAPVWNKTCYSADQLMAMVGTQTGIRGSEFRDICPALLYQQVTGACLPMPSTPASATGSQTSDVQKWVFAMLAVFIISLCALVGGVLFCCRKARPGVYDCVINAFLGLAVGTLVADAFLHLLPEALGLHSHGEEATLDAHAHESEGIVLEDSTQKMLLFIMVIFAMYLFETLTSHFCCMGHVHSHGPETQKYELHEAVHGHQPLEAEGKTQEEKISRGCLEPVVMMVVIGDAIHNFADGLAIGAAFSISHAAGLATSIAVFCHELPHELGDLAVMLEAGLSMCMALLLNFVSALTAFLGAAVSLGLLSGLPQAQTWIFTIAAAIFTYIALVIIIPKLSLWKQSVSKTAQFLFVIMGMIVGIGIMLVLALFEEKLGNLAV